MKTDSKFSRWYKNNQGKLGLKRKTRYKNDPEYREAAKLRAREYRASFPHKTPNDPVILTVDGVPRSCWRIGQAAARIGCPRTIFRTWERSGHLPPPTVEAKIRTYTTEQVDLLVPLWEAMLSYREAEGNARQEARTYMDAVGAHIIENWE